MTTFQISKHSLQTTEFYLKKIQNVMNGSVLKIYPWIKSQNLLHVNRHPTIVILSCLVTIGT